MLKGNLFDQFYSKDDVELKKNYEESLQNGALKMQTPKKPML